MMIRVTGDDALTLGPAAAPDHGGRPTTRTPTARVTFAELKPLTERLREPGDLNGSDLSGYYCRTNPNR
jgi:hypothetical protein